MLHGNEFLDKIDHNSAPVKDNCALFAPTLSLYAAARLYSVAVGQIPRSTKRISSIGKNFIHGRFVLYRVVMIYIHDIYH